MVWSCLHDKMLRPEIMVVNPFTATLKSTNARAKKWEEVAENTNCAEVVYLKVDKRAHRDR